MNVKIASLLLLSLCLTGCGLYVVKKPTAGGDYQGIPFYVKTAGCKREIVWLKPYDVLTLTTKTGEKTSHAESIAVCRENFASALFLAVRNAPGTGNSVDIADSWNDMKTLRCDPLDQPPLGSKNWFIASDTIAAYPYVDYQTPYTLNVRRPIMGSASATTKLATDGTLSEGTAQVEDKTVETLLNTITSTLTGPKALGITSENFPYELKIEEKGVKFTWTYRDPATHGNCEKDAQLLSDPPTTGKPDLVIADAGTEKKTADDSNTVKVSGTVQLPKAKDSGADAKK